jgi:predicted phage terminase large subunit-like protein
MSRQFLAYDTDIVDAICRLDFVSFIRKCFHTLSPNTELLMNWHIYALAYQLEQVRCGKIKRLNVNFPPRMLKSLISSVAFPAFILGHDPTKRVIVVSYGSDLAIKLANDFRAILNAPWYRRVFPGTRISRTENTEFEVVTTQNGGRLAVSIDGALTGRGGDFVIVDDPLKAIDARSDGKRERVNYLFTSSVLTRLDNKQTGAIVLVMQRLDPNDPVGKHCSSDEWTTLSFPAIAERDESIQIGKNQCHLRRVGDVLHPQLEPLDVLERIRSQMPLEDFAAQYQQNPVPAGGTMIKRERVLRYDRLPNPTSLSKVIQSWDTALKEGELNDYSVCTTWLYHEKKYYLVDVLRERFDFPTLRMRAIAHAHAHHANTILIEDTGVGTALVSELKNAGLPAIAVKPQHGKQIRMFIQSQKFENGTALLPKQAPWLPDLESELFAFPHTVHDDQVDSISQTLAYEPDVYDLAAIAKGMEGFLLGVECQSLFRGRVV